MTAGGESRGGYRPFPSFDDWLRSDYDTTVFDRMDQRLAERRATTDLAALDRAVERATREAAVDTGAIEGLYRTDRGFTRTVATQAAAWESLAAARGPAVLDSIRDALAAYEFVLDAATGRTRITEIWIRDLHTVMCRSQTEFTVQTPVGPQVRALPHGRYRTDPNSPTNLSTGRVHHYAPPLDTRVEMGRLVAEVRSPAFRGAPPVVQAAWAHYAYVCVHPFADGNGRVARALASVFLYRRPGIPLVVFADQRDRYLDALEAADRGNHEAFTSFIDERVADTISVVLATVHASARSRQELIADLRPGSGAADGAVEPQQLQDAALRLNDAVVAAFARQVAELAEAGVDGVMWRGSEFEPSWATAYRRPPGPTGLILFLPGGPPQGRRNTEVQILVRRDLNAPADLVVASTRGRPADGLEIQLREIEPRVTESLRLELDGWARRQADLLLEGLS